jgi:hypothetical protein
MPHPLTRRDLLRALSAAGVAAAPGGRLLVANPRGQSPEEIAAAQQQMVQWFDRWV